MQRHDTNLTSPLDGRYRSKTEIVAQYFSEAAHIKTCFDIELDYWFLMRSLFDPNGAELKTIPAPTEAHYQAAAGYENLCKHDIKSVEYAVRDYLLEHKLGHTNLVHYGLTSQDIVSFSWNYRMKNFVDTELLPKINELVVKMEEIDGEAYTPIYCRTHGQRGNITTMGHEISKFTTRLLREYDKINDMNWVCKFSGSTGDFTSLHILHPYQMMNERLGEFMDENYGMRINDCSTQTDNWYSMCELFTYLNNISNILIDFCRDIWMYHMNGDISFGAIDKLQVGSSVMPQKINPIDIENAEGNLEMCSMWYNFFVNKLPKSRLQRDLSDSVVIRHIPISMANFVLAITNLVSGVENIKVDGIEVLDYSVFAEIIQTKLRSMGDDQAYDKVKRIFRNGKKFNRKDFDEAMKVLFNGGDWQDIHQYVASIEK